MATLPFRIFSSRDLGLLRQRLADCLVLSHEKWFPATAPGWEIESIANVQCADERVPLIVESGIAVFASRESISGLYDALTADRHHHATHTGAMQLSRALVEKMLRDMLQTIAPPALSAYQSAPLQYRGAGTVVVEVRQGKHVLTLLVPQQLAIEYATVSLAAKGAVTLASRREGIGQGRLRLRVCLGETELRLADLAELAPGHVLRLGAVVDRPFTLINAETGQKMCDANLGQRDGYKAIQLTQ